MAHVCETGAARKTWLRGCENVAKRYWMTVAGHNLGVIMRTLFGIGTPRGMQGAAAAFLAVLMGLLRHYLRHIEFVRLSRSHQGQIFSGSPIVAVRSGAMARFPGSPAFSTPS